MTLIGGYRYVQAQDPGAVGAGFEWLNTQTNLWYIRNASNSGWTRIGNLGMENCGNLPISGGEMMGPITGAHGLLPEDSPNATTSLKVDGFDVARIADLNAVRQEVMASIRSALSGVVNVGSGSSILDKVAFAVVDATLTPTANGSEATISAGTIALPTYPGGGTAQASEVRAYGMGIIGWKAPAIATPYTALSAYLTETTTRTYTLTSRNMDLVKVQSWILATRA